VYFNLRDILPNSGTYLPGHSVYNLYVDATVVLARYVCLS